jgi:hypothetical protein
LMRYAPAVSFVVLSGRSTSCRSRTLPDVGLDVGQDRDALVQVSDLWFMEVVIAEDASQRRYFIQNP